MAITPLPSLDRTSASFKTDVDTFFATKLPTFSTEVEAARLQIETDTATASSAATTATGAASTATTKRDEAVNAASTATTQAGNASTSATAAQNYAAALNSTSTTSLTIGTGSKSFTTQSGKQYAVGQFVLAVSAANSANYMHGQVTSYSGTSLVVNVTATGGSGTLADWNLSVSGTRGAAGAAGTLSGNATGSIDMNGYAFNEAHGADIASAATINLDSATGNLVDVTGTTNISAITLSDGHKRTVRFTGALTLVNSASLVLIGGANITTAAGDFAEFYGYAAGVVRMMSYTRAAAMGATLGSNVFSGKQTISGAACDQAKSSDVASAATINLDAATGNLVHVTGTTTIAAITLTSGAERDVVFDGALILTHSASLILPGAANITTAAGDRATFRGDGAGVVRCMHYTKASGLPVVSAGATAASQAQMEAASDNTVMVTPANTNWHPGVAKAWLTCGVTGNILASHNITSITDLANGRVTVTIANDFSSANYVVTGCLTGGATRVVQVETGQTAGAFTAHSTSLADTDNDPTNWHFACFGDQ